MYNIDWNNPEDCEFVQNLIDDWCNKHPYQQEIEQENLVERYAQSLDYLNKLA